MWLKSQWAITVPCLLISLSKRTGSSECGWWCGEIRTLKLLGGSVKWCKLLETGLLILQDLKLESSSFTPSYTFKSLQSRLKESLNISVHSDVKAAKHGLPRVHGILKQTKRIHRTEGYLFSPGNEWNSAMSQCRWGPIHSPVCAEDWTQGLAHARHTLSYCVLSLRGTLTTYFLKLARYRRSTKTAWLLIWVP